MRWLCTFAILLCVYVVSIGLLWSQAQPKPAPSPTSATQETAPATLLANAQRSTIGIQAAFASIVQSIQRIRLCLPERRRNVWPGAIGLISTDQERVRITEE